MAQALTLKRVAEEDFFSLVGLSDLSDEKKEEILAAINKTIFTRVYGYIYQEFTPELRAELDTIPAEKMILFLTEKGFNIPQMIIEETLSYRLELAKMFELATNPLIQSVSPEA